MKAVGTNTESNTRVIARGHLRHRLFRRFGGGQLRFRLEDVFDRFDDDDRIVDHDADGQHQR